MIGDIQYTKVKKELPRDTPQALGKPIILTPYVDTNLYHDVFTERSVTGILYFINQTFIV